MTQTRQTRRRRRDVDPNVLLAIEELCGHYGPVEIRRELEARKELADKRLPEVWTIRRLCDELAPRDPDDQWRVRNAEPDELEHVIPVLGEAWRKSKSRITSVTNAEAEWIVRVRRARHDLDLWTVYRLARRYRAKEIRDESVDALDLQLATWDPTKPIPPGATITGEVRDEETEARIQESMQRHSARVKKEEEGE